jgi:phosphatidylinositol alpha-1,6-mannosyltransferase
VVLTVGRLQERKGHDVFIRALPQVRQAIPDILYVIVGDGAERQRLEALVDEHGVRPQVQFRGEPVDEELIRCYQQCDLFVLPNREVGGDFEGFGMVLVEAQACGKPVIAGASGGTRETMRVPETGLIIPCEEPIILANTVIALLTDPSILAAMGTAARDWASSQFDWQSLCSVAQTLLGFERSVSRLSLPIITS